MGSNASASSRIPFFRYIRDNRYSYPFFANMYRYRDLELFVHRRAACVSAATIVSAGMPARKMDSRKRDSVAACPWCSVEFPPV
jgi:hypothetical protein